MMSRTFGTMLSVLLVAVPTAAASQAQPVPEPVQRVFACRAITDNGKRLQCFDDQVRVLQSVQGSGELVTMSRQQVRSTRRSLFGLALPNLSVFGDNSSDANAGVLETTIKVARQNPGGKWQFELEEGGRWVQLDTREFVIDPAPRQTIRIRRATMNSYLANVNKQTAIRIERVR